MAGLSVLGKINPDGGIVVGFIGELERIAVVRGEVFLWVEAEPEGKGAGLEVDVLGSSEKDRILVLGGEAERARAPAACAGGEFYVWRGAQSRRGLVLQLVGCGGVKPGVSFGSVSVGIFIE